MCTGLELAAIASTVATGAGQYMNYRAGKKAEKRYNEQVNNQNRLLEKQYADRQQKLYAGKDEQARIFNETAAAQDAELENQKKMSAEKQQLFQDMLANPINTAAAPEAEAARAERNKLFADTDVTLGGSYNPTANGTTENRVIQDAAEKAQAKEGKKTAGIADAAARLGAMGDVRAKQGILFGDLTNETNTINADAQAAQRLLEMRLRPKQYRSGAVGAAMGDAVQTPYFRGEEPVFQQPNTLFGDLMSGAGQLGTSYFTTQLPKNRWRNPDTGVVVSI